MKKRYLDEKKDELYQDTIKTGKTRDDGLENALGEMGQMGSWLWMMFILTCSPGLLTTMHNTSYVFIGADLPHWCDMEQLHQTNWTQHQIRTIVTGDSSKSSCTAINWNYTELAELTYEEAFALTNSTSNPGSFKCDKFTYIGSGVMSQWDLVCSRTNLRTSVQMALALGNFIGSFLFGFVADKWGRKRSFVGSCALYMVSGMVSSFTGSYLVFVLARIAIGMAGTACYNSAYTLLNEVCAPKHRSLFGNLYNMPYGIGMVVLSAVAFYLDDDWQTLQLALCAPAFILIVHCWVLPESPRWLISQGRREEAWEVVKKATRGRRKQTIEPKVSIIEEEEIFKEAAVAKEVEKEFPTPWLTRVINSLSKITSLFYTSEMRWRTLICYFTWFANALSYYALALNADNFSSNRYIYIAIAGVVEAVSITLPVPILKVIGRRLCCGILYFIAGAVLLSILLIPQGSSVTIMAVAMVGRFCIGAVYSVIVLYATELFPTENRNTAIGTCSMFAHIGSMSAPFVVDLLGAVAWYIPSTLCGISSLLAGLLVLLLPETKDKILCDTVQEVLDNEEDRTTIKNFCICK